MNNLTLALRHLWRKKIYTFVILFSLTVGFTCANLLISFLITEQQTDSFHRNRERIFQVFTDDPFSGSGNISYIPHHAGAYIESTYPEVEKICRFSQVPNVYLETEDGKSSEILLASTDSTFFSVFSFPIVDGVATNLFSPENILLSKAKALTLFGTSDVVGEFIILKSPDTVRAFNVAGVLDENSVKSHLKFDAIIHHSALKRAGAGGASYMLLSDASSAPALAGKINADIHRPSLLGPGALNYFLEPLENSYFNKANTLPYMQTRTKTVIWIGYAVCGLVLFMASFNFINLFLLSLQGRKKQAGIRKTLGISMSNIFKGTLAEILIYIIAGAALAVVVTMLILPLFNDILETTLQIQDILQFKVLLVIASLLMILAVIVLIASTLQQAKVKPVSLLQKNSVSKLTFNRALFTAQFVISITLAVCATTLIRQTQFIRTESLGFNRNILQLAAPEKKLGSKLPVLKQKLLELPSVNNVSVCSGNPISGNSIARYDLDDETHYTPYVFSGDEDFVKTLGLTLIKGDWISARRNGKLVNETLVKKFNLSNPIGAKIPGTEDEIIGVVKDFTCVSFKLEIPPVIISYADDDSRLLVDYAGQDPFSLLPAIKKVWKEVFTDYNFSYQVIQQDLLAKYREETFFINTVVAFAVVSMILSCFGLFALSWAVIETRVKEIGIRKVLGATSRDILNLLSVAFLKRIILAFCIAAPAGYFLMEKWLETFEKKAPITIWIFVVSAGVILFIAFATISFQTIRAALTNPVDELRNE